MPPSWHRQLSHHLHRSWACKPSSSPGQSPGRQAQAHSVCWHTPLALSVSHRDLGRAGWWEGGSDDNANLHSSSGMSGNIPDCWNSKTWEQSWQGCDRFYLPAHQHTLQNISNMLKVFSLERLKTNSWGLKKCWVWKKYFKIMLS